MNSLTETPPWAWVVFGVVVLGALFVDLFIGRAARERTPKESVLWVGVWVGLALLFNVGVYYWKGARPAYEFFSAYLVEQSLSVDNLFVFLLLFRYFQVPAQRQHRVLFWGILGAIAMRAVMIIAGVELLQKFTWFEYVFGGFLILTGLKLFFSSGGEHDPSQSWPSRLLKRCLPFCSEYEGERFFIRRPDPKSATGKLVTLATPLFLVLLLVEFTDLLFALDSIPACLGLSRDPFVVYTSNIFAVLCLRALYFLLARSLFKLRFLNPALALLLVGIGAKMLVPNDPETGESPISILLMLGGVVGILGLAIAASLLFPGKPAPEPPAAVAPEPAAPSQQT